ncbi:ArsB/NhaD family transporter [Sporolactobacillus inulinus]|jgi:Na+/H+ antiporter NhaD/arsenite permease-like protein|uniref:Membrane protein n=2 Tax=Sporolactobacillus inulinus TaxID=2078 RepID=A0A0U1QPK6_9BACL|nr:ArsB/NhaD family transporter [Sporolactobacillus inulinus]KLI02747.1 membrane protein [Sporolactobacillus inulinus CASD]GEB77573.1 membrane protein [Sporolactobacillus inulinus]
MGNESLLAIGIFVLTYGLIIAEKIHRTIIAMIGGGLMIVLGIVSQHAALAHIDFNTLGLLIGMMIIVSITAETGLFKFIALWAAKKVGGRPVALLVVFSLITALGSSFLDNVTTVLLMVPVTFSISRALKVSPIPFLISEILMSNIGGTATMIGDPPNIMIGSAVKSLSFMDFITNLAPVIIIIMVLTLLILRFIYRKQLTTTDEAREQIAALDPSSEIVDRLLLIKSLAVLLLTISGFFLHQALGLETATVALMGAFLLLLLSGEKQLERALHQVEWTTIFFFVGLFVLVGGLEETGMIRLLAEQVIQLTGGNLAPATFLILWMSGFASAFIDNIPFVATMIPLIQDMGQMGVNDLEPIWWSLSLGACLGGNGMLIGASANLIVAGLSGKEGYPITFLRFMKIGLPVMILSLVISTVYIYFRYLT